MPHLDLTTLRAQLSRLPPPPRDQGRVVLLVQREPEEKRRTPELIRLSCKDGVIGDRWSRALLPNPDAQVTVMRADVAHMMRPGQDIACLGDNLFVDLDLSEANLPIGSRLHIGGTICEVTPKPHTGCRKFEVRAGRDARELTRLPELVPLRLRGLHLRVRQEGEIRLGDLIRVERP